MTKSEFLNNFSQEILQLDYVVTEDTFLIDLEEWDSLTQIMTISFVDKHMSITITHDEIFQMNTVQDLLKKINL